MMRGMEDLRAYLNGLPVAEQELFAKRCGTTVGYLRKLLATGDLVREKTCVAIERESGGAVTRMALRPDDWREIWPELDESMPELVAAGQALMRHLDAKHQRTMAKYRAREGGAA